MILIAILISLGVEKALPAWQNFRRFDWFVNFASLVRARIGAIRSGALVVLLIIIPVPLIVGLIFYGLYEAQELLGFLFAVLVLWFCLGPKNLDSQIQTYLQALETGDMDTTQRMATELLHEQIPGSNFQLNGAVTESILVQANERILAVWFWFAVLGPLGAVMYRLSSLLKNLGLRERDIGGPFADAALRLHAILDWLPARLTALGYAISGSFVDALGGWHSSAAWRENWEKSNIGILVATGLGALQLSADALRSANTELDPQPDITQIKSAQALVWRTLVVWIVVIALMTVAGWAA